MNGPFSKLLAAERFVLKREVCLLEFQPPVLPGVWINSLLHSGA